MTDSLKEREAFFSDHGKWPAAVERSGEGYKLAAAQSAWVTWQACCAAIDAALAARGAVPAGWADEILDLIEEYGSERATGTYHGEHFCRQKPADLLKKIRAMVAAAPQQVAQPNLLSWAVDRWLAEVSNRPLVNKNRRTLDDTWRQVIRFAGGDPDELIGPCHDTLLAAAPQPKD